MILYKAIKYSIIDYCINSFFDKLYKNLNNKPIGSESIKVGDRFASITDYGIDEYNIEEDEPIFSDNIFIRYYNCKIKEIKTYTDENILVIFSCDHSKSFVEDELYSTTMTDNGVVWFSEATFERI